VPTCALRWYSGSGEGRHARRTPCSNRLKPAPPLLRTLYQIPLAGRPRWDGLEVAAAASNSAAATGPPTPPAAITWSPERELTWDSGFLPITASFLVKDRYQILD